MSKGNWLTLGIATVVSITVVVVALMILLPQQSVVLDASTVKYEAIKKSDFVYEQTKNITRDALIREYAITSEQMDSFKRKNYYVAGNSDPFTPSGASTSGPTSNNNSNSKPSGSVSTTDKITNSNGGVANPPSTNK